MVSLLITLPDPLAEASNKAAKTLGISRTEFIRQAISRELDNFKTKLEEKQIIKSFNAMKGSKEYLRESETITDSLFADLPNEKDQWWNR